MQRQPRINIKLVVACFVILLLGGIWGAWRGYEAKQKGTVSIILDAPDTANLKATLGTTPLQLKAQNKVSTVVHKGYYTLTVSKTGYRSFSRSFTVHTGDTILFNIPLQRTSLPSFNTAIFSSLSPATAGADVLDSQYFGNHDWLFVSTIASSGNNTFYILRYDDVSGRWVIETGPNTIMSQSATSSYPRDLQQYLQSNNYTSEDS